jgi:hypothetical protein
MRKELKLPFNEDHFARILEKGNTELENYLASFFQDVEQSTSEDKKSSDMNFF